MKKVFSIFLLICSVKVNAQDISYNRMIVDTLSSPAFWGRGYTKDGMKKAGEYLSQQFRLLGVKPLDGKDYLQPFSYSANTFPDDMKVSINDKKLIPGIDFIVDHKSKGFEGKGKLLQKDSLHFTNTSGSLKIILENKLTWSASQTQDSFATVKIDKTRFKGIPSRFKIEIESQLIKNFLASNVCGMIPGTQKPDSFLFITAHYDHLGGMGEDTYFPGANDNASGVALLLSLAKYYVANQQKYSIGFILFAGEEIGLLGSKYYSEYPTVPLKNIRFLTNTDLAGTGEEGITVVNATLFPDEFALMNRINDEHKYLSAIGARGKAANSDHYWFTEKGVPSFFFYTRGGVTFYHDVRDRAATLPLNEQADLLKLIVKFNEGLQGN